MLRLRTKARPAAVLGSTAFMPLRISPGVELPHQYRRRRRSTRQWYRGPMCRAGHDDVRTGAKPERGDGRAEGKYRSRGAWDARKSRAGDFAHLLALF